jgi:hypothetical protein
MKVCNNNLNLTQDFSMCSMAPLEVDAGAAVVMGLEGVVDLEDVGLDVLSFDAEIKAEEAAL